ARKVIATQQYHTFQNKVENLLQIITNLNNKHANLMDLSLASLAASHSHPRMFYNLTQRSNTKESEDAMIIIQSVTTADNQNVKIVKPSKDKDDGDKSSKDEETPKMAKASKKNYTESTSKIPIFNKKPKLVTYQNNDEKGGGYTITLHPSKQGRKIYYK
ncbi:hypothetical protein RJ641_013046, partial [Dillenia turbinata]